MAALWRKSFAEAIGTFALVFAGTGAIVIDGVTKGGVTHVGVALTFGLVVMAMIYAVGESSGAHLNPAVTLGFAATGRFAWREVPAYIAAQLVGALLASCTLRMLFPTDLTLGTTLPAFAVSQSFILEFLLTAILMFVILGVSTGSKEAGVMAGIAVGATIGLEALFAGPISGASMNPARSIAPALVSQTFTHLWLYIVAPIAGSLAGAAAWSIIRPPVRGLEIKETRNA